MKLRVRTAMKVGFLVVGVLPLALLTWLTYERMLSRELSEVEDRHLLLAQNISAALSRYEKDVRAAIKIISESLEQGKKLPNSENLMSVFKIQDVSIVDAATKQTIASTNGNNTDLAKQFGGEWITLVEKHATSSNFRFTPIWRISEGNNVIFSVAKINGDYVVGRIGTDYFRSLGEAISFGVKGHAAIVDHEGNLFSHPLKSWTKQAKNISKVSAVRRMMNGETGVEQFYSPALKGDMIAGLTSIQGPGWGVMIPQPMAELEAKAYENLMPMFAGFVIAFMLTAFLIIQSVRSLARPLENLNEDMKEQSRTGAPRAISPHRANSNIIELSGIVNAYNELSLTVQNHSRELDQKIYEDTVTGIGNRSYFTKGSNEQISLRVSQGKRGVLMFLDLDGFKEINDIRGHGVGDQVLKEFAKTLYPATKRFMDKKFRGIAGAHPVIGRLGGDEFAILLPIPDGTDDVSEICEELRQSFVTSTSVDGIEISFGVSAGGAVYPDQGTSIDELIRRSDVALYMAKAEGKDCFKLYSRTNALGSKSEILASVVKAIENDELVLAYQPKFSVESQQVDCVEALLRWNHPEHGILTPNLFLPAIQQTAVMASLGDWVVARAIKDMQKLDETGHTLNVAVNIGVEHFSTSGFVESLVAKCESESFPADRMQIEITENIMDASRAVFQETVLELQQNGFTVAIDDFGSGFSNLTRIASVPVDVIKLDGSLIREAINDNRVHVIVETAIEMSHALGSQVVVEGVETLEQVKMAEDAGADSLQGFYFSKALPPQELDSWLNQCQTNAPQDRLRDLKASVG